MTKSRLVVLLAGVSLLACGSSVGGDDGGARDAGGMDSGMADSGRPADGGAVDDGDVDGGAVDGGAVDGGAVDGGAVDDSGIDCSVIGCGAPVFCGETCDAPCGCCSCGSETFCADDDLVTCAGGCYERTPCGVCVEGAGGAACSTETCGDIEAEYLAAIGGAAMRCGGPRSCHVLDGHCGVGLGGCYHAVNTGVTQAQLNALAARWTALGCELGRAVCDCAPPPTTVRCDSGGCLAR